ncbi:MAG: septal ring lytic transglycosylase RlpA family protein [Acidobacteriia bacterium]|nr:septal ring lytic transglycosylase RlpA family protein [Terriglobia bacterium]
MKAILLLAIPVMFLILRASGKDGDSSTVPASIAPKHTATETGIASWYGYPYHGRHAADGEIYDMEKLTAAHRTLPFGTWVRVVNLRNERAVEVRINDRGPFVEGRIIDLSRAAARAVDMIAAGIVAVRVEVLGTPENLPTDRFAVQVGAFRNRRNARRCLALMRSRYGSARLALREGDPDLWRVLVGSEHTEDDARSLATRIRQESAEQAAFVARLDR